MSIDLPDGVTCTEGPGGLPVLHVSTPQATAQIHLLGAQATSWAPQGQEDVLFLSADAVLDGSAPIRGGIPVCFPWFGPGTLPGQEGPLSPAHGFARLVPWRLVEATTGAGGVTIVLALADADVEGAQGRQEWPHSFEARLTTVVGAELTQSLEVTNTGDEPFAFEEALHTYLAVTDVDASAVEGLAGARYHDKVLGADDRLPEGEAGVIRPAGELDRVHHAGGQVTVRDGRGDRTITVTKEHSAQTVVWNPGTTKAAAIRDLHPEGWRRFLCVEAANAGPGAVSLAPGESHTMTQRISVG